MIKVLAAWLSEGGDRVFYQLEGGVGSMANQSYPSPAGPVSLWMLLREANPALRLREDGRALGTPPALYEEPAGGFIWSFPVGGG